MSSDIKEEIERLQRDYAAKLIEIQAKQDWQALLQLNQELQKAIIELTTGTTHTSPLGLVKPQSQHYRHSECSLDLDHFVYDGDREYFEAFLQNPLIASHVLGPNKKPAFNSKRELLKTALRLTKGMAPKVFNSVERCRERLGLTSDIEIFVAQNPSMNAFCYPPHEGGIYILMTSGLLEKLDEDELTFVIGHEIGHFLYNHHLLNSAYISGMVGHELSPAENIKLFSWGRNAELTADRVGLICCGSYESACTANFKLSSGIASDILSFSLTDYIKQYEDVENEMRTGEGSPEDFYSSHPISPMRVIALDLFFRSETYCNTFASNTTPELSENEMENKISGFMKLMEPSYLNGTDDQSNRIKEFMFLAGLTIASSDKVVKDEEMKFLCQLLPNQNHNDLYEKMKSWDIEMLLSTLREQAEKIIPHINFSGACNIIRDLILLSVSDGDLCQNEVDNLVQICQMLDIQPGFIDQVLSSINYQKAA